MIYKFVFAFFRSLSRLPFWVLHRISDFFFVLLYYVIRYRRKVVLRNLAIAFPNNSLSQNKKIARKFMRHFADFLIESLKTLSISENELKKRYIYLNPEVAQKEIEAGKSLMMVAGHLANWEWLFYYNKITGVHTWAAYSPLTNPIFDKLMVANRERYGFKVVPSKKASSALARLNEEGTQFVNCLMADQSPRANYKYRAKFLGIDVPFFIGPEAYAMKYNLPVFYGRVKKIARSKYTVEIIPIALKPLEKEKGWIMQEYIRLLEEDIFNAPENYLWSHKRFKHAEKQKI
jgi:KDO2-lipid IV(A) lauroyltransferase